MPTFTDVRNLRLIEFTRRLKAELSKSIDERIWKTRDDAILFLQSHYGLTRRTSIDYLRLALARLEVKNI
jgi:hypothetical protein